MQKHTSLLLCLLLSFGSLLAQSKDTTYNQIDSNGRMQGYWQKKYPNGRTAYRAYFVDGKPIGILVRYHENGRKMAVIDYFDDGTAFAQLFSPQETLVGEGYYAGENTKNGLWKYYRSGKLMRDENYVNGLLHGIAQIYFPSGKVFERKHYQNGLQNGVYEQVDERGKLVFEIMFKDGKQNGLARYYYDSGQLRIEGVYKDDLRDGEWIFYESNGEVERKTTYTNGIAADKDAEEKKNSDYLKQLERDKGKYVEPEKRLEQWE